LIAAFEKYIVNTMKLAVTNGESNIRTKAKRLVGIWKDRQILGETVIDELAVVVDSSELQSPRSEVGSPRGSASKASSPNGANANGGLKLDVGMVASPSSFTMIASPRPQDAVETSEFKELIDILQQLEDMKVSKDLVCDRIKHVQRLLPDIKQFLEGRKKRQEKLASGEGGDEEESDEDDDEDDEDEDDDDEGGGSDGEGEGEGEDEEGEDEASIMMFIEPLDEGDGADDDNGESVAETVKAKDEDDAKTKKRKLASGKKRKSKRTKRVSAPPAALLELDSGKTLDDLEQYNKLLQAEMAEREKLLDRLRVLVKEQKASIAKKQVGIVYSYTMHHTPYIIHHAPYTLHHTPCTMHHTHTPYTIHHTPCTILIHPAPCIILIHPAPSLQVEDAQNEQHRSGVDTLKVRAHSYYSGHTVLTHTPTLCSHTVLPHCAPTLCSHTVLTHCAPTLCSSPRCE
jgi:hypothetical protein